MAKSVNPRGRVRARSQASGKEATRARLADLDARLNAVKSRHAGDETEPSGGRGAALGMAFRLATELVVGILVGGFIGWQLDKWLDTTPLFLLVFFALGFVAGLFNVIRTARAMQLRAGGDAGQDASLEQDGD